MPSIEPNAVHFVLQRLPVPEVRYASHFIPPVDTTHAFLQPLKAYRMVYYLVIILKGAWGKVNEGLKCRKFVTTNL